MDHFLNFINNFTVDLITVGTFFIIVMVLASLFIWIPRRTKEWFGISVYQLKDQNSASFSRSLGLALKNSGLRPEQSFFNLPTTSYVIRDKEGKRILIDGAIWDKNPTARYWMTLEELRLSCHADEAWSIQPGLDGVWTQWLETGDLLKLKLKTLSQLVCWVNVEHQHNHREGQLT